MLAGPQYIWGPSVSKVLTELLIDMLYMEGGALADDVASGATNHDVESAQLPLVCVGFKHARRGRRRRRTAAPPRARRLLPRRRGSHVTPVPRHRGARARARPLPASESDCASAVSGLVAGLSRRPLGPRAARCDSDLPARGISALTPR